MRMQRLLRISSVLVILGLLAEIASVFWFHPLSFVLFVFVAATLVAVGIVVYLISLVFFAAPRGENRDSD